MVDQAYNRTPIYQLEKPLADDINQGESQDDRSIRDTMFALLNGASGFIGRALAVVPQGPPALGVTIKAGIGFQDAPTDVPSSIAGVAGLNDLSRYKPIVLALDYNIAVPAVPGSNSRIDLIEVRYNRQLDNAQSREFLDPTSGAFSPALVAKTLDFNVDGTLGYFAAAATPTTAIAYKSGVVSGSPTAPTVDTGYMPLALILVTSTTTTIVASVITDERALIGGGRILGVQTLTGSGTYTPTPSTSRIHVMMCGGGAGGGGAGGGGNSAAGGGGASGSTLDIWINATGLAGGAFVCGAGGAGGVGNSSGATGVDTTLTINGTTLTAKGGLPGAGMPSAATFATAGGSLDPGSGPGGIVSGDNGSTGVVLSGVVVSGSGGSSRFGGGGPPVFIAPSAGTAASGFGSGGSGAAATTTNQTGGAGSAGVIVIEEYA